MPRFVDRHRELRALRVRLDSRASLSLLYGQRRVGKTYLLQEALAGRPGSLHWAADESTPPVLLQRFAREVAARGLGGPMWDLVTPPDWSTALTLLFESAATRDTPLVLVFDELQHLLAGEPALTSILQRLWDGYRERLGLHLVLCGSALGTLSKLGDEEQPLHGRFDLRLKLRPFGYVEAAEFFPGWTPADQLRGYGVFGGLGRHLASVVPQRDLTNNAIEHIIDPFGRLHEAPLDILRSEHLSSRAEAEAVLTAIACGENRFGAIASRTGLSATRADFVLKELQALDLVLREGRFGDKPGARYARYRCADPFLSFWFRFVAPNRTALIGASAEQVWRERIAPRLRDHMGRIFERVVAHALVTGRLIEHTGPVDRVAPWWSRDGQTEIDVVARAGDTTWLVECKWRAGGDLDLDALQQLRAHAGRLPARRIPGPHRLALATAGGFTERVRRVAEAEDVLLIGLDQLLPG